MYSCEKLARGRGSKSGIVHEGRNTIIKKSEQEYITRRIEEEHRNRDKFQYNFADPRKYSVQEELYEDRPRGRIYRSRKR